MCLNLPVTRNERILANTRTMDRTMVFKRKTTFANPCFAGFGRYGAGANLKPVHWNSALSLRDAVATWPVAARSRTNAAASPLVLSLPHLCLPAALSAGGR